MSIYIKEANLNIEIGNNNDLKKLFDYCNEKYFNNKYENISLSWNSRFFVVAGQCNKVKKEIEIGVRFHKVFKEELLNTMVHEMIHLSYANHGAGFKKEALRINSKYNLGIKRTYNTKELMLKYNIDENSKECKEFNKRSEYKWIYTCNNCNNSFKTVYRQKGNLSIPPKYFCSKCQYGKDRTDISVFREERIE